MYKTLYNVQRQQQSTYITGHRDICGYVVGVIGRGVYSSSRDRGRGRSRGRSRGSVGVVIVH